MSGFNQYGAATVNPALDTPSYTPGWQDQTDTGDLEAGGGLASLSGAGYNVNGYLASTMAPENSLVGGFSAPVSAKFYGVLTYIPAGESTKFFTNPATVSGNTHAYVAVLDTSGNTLAKSADLTTLSSGVGNWASAYTFESGLYYVGVGLTWATTQTTLDGMAIHGAIAANGANITYVAGSALPRVVLASVTITSSFPSTVTLAKDTGLAGAPFVGIL